MKNQITVGSGAGEREGTCLVVLYENALAREQAVKLCEDFAAQSAGAAARGIRWLSFEELGSAENAGAVMEAAAEAEVIVFALTAEGELPGHVKLWTETWLGKRGEREGALIGLVSDARNGPCDMACFKEVYLRHLAHRAGMNYLTHLPVLARNPVPDSLDSFNERAGQTSALLDAILHQPFVPPSVQL